MSFYDSVKKLKRELEIKPKNVTELYEKQHKIRNLQETF